MEGQIFYHPVNYEEKRAPSGFLEDILFRCRFSNIGEEAVGDLACDGTQKPAAELGDLAACIAANNVGEDCGAAILVKPHIGYAVGEACNGAFAMAGNRVGFRRSHIGKFQHSMKADLKNAETYFQCGADFGFGNALYAIATGNAGFQCFNIVQRIPNGLPRRCNPFFSGKIDPCFTPTCIVLNGRI